MSLFNNNKNNNNNRNEFFIKKWNVVTESQLYPKYQVSDNKLHLYEPLQESEFENIDRNQSIRFMYSIIHLFQSRLVNEYYWKTRCEPQ